MTRTILHPWMTHPHTGKPLEAVGIVRGRPVWPIMGASEDDPEGDPEGDPEDDPDDDPEDDPDDDPWAGKSDAELRSELKRLSGAHGKAKSQAQRWREFAQGKTDTAPDGTKRAAPKPAPPKTEPKTKDGGFTRADLEAAVEEARNEARRESSQGAIRTSARAELKAAGLTLPADSESAKDVMARAVRLLDLDDVTVEDGEVVGLEDAIDSLKKLLPGMFKGSANGGGGNGRRRAPNPGNTGGGKGGSGKQLSATERQAAALFGGKDD